MTKSKKILVLAPHTDDGELGCGGMMAKWSNKAEIAYLAFSTCDASLPEGWPEGTLAQESKTALSKLGVSSITLLDFPVRNFSQHRQAILQALIDFNRTFGADRVFFPASTDVHQDHRLVTEEAFRAFKTADLLGYELPWNNTRFQPTVFEKISPLEMAKKEEAVSAYASQQHRAYMKEGFLRSLARVRGIQCGADYAEAFECYRISS